MEEKKQKKASAPHTFVIIGVIILCAVFLTWIIPAGNFERVTNSAGLKVVNPASFLYVEATPVNPLKAPLFIIEGLVKSADLFI